MRGWWVEPAQALFVSFRNNVRARSCTSHKSQTKSRHDSHAVHVCTRRHPIPFSAKSNKTPRALNSVFGLRTAREYKSRRVRRARLSFTALRRRSLRRAPFVWLGSKRACPSQRRAAHAHCQPAAATNVTAAMSLNARGELPVGAQLPHSRRSRSRRTRVWYRFALVRFASSSAMVHSLPPAARCHGESAPARPVPGSTSCRRQRRRRYPSRSGPASVQQSHLAVHLLREARTFCVIHDEAVVFVIVRDVVVETQTVLMAHGKLNLSLVHSAAVNGMCVCSTHAYF